MSTVLNKDKYIEAVGRRKTSVARVRITPASKTVFKINEKELDVYFQTAELRKVIEEPISKTKIGDFTISVRLRGGGIHSQAEALRHGLSRALVTYDESTKAKLKSSGLLTRDSRAKERRKFGLKKARKAPKWSKR